MDMGTNLINSHSLLILCYSLALAVRPLTVKIIQDLKFMSTKQSYDLRCEVRGSRPAAKISWWLGSVEMFGHPASKDPVSIVNTHTQKHDLAWQLTKQGRTMQIELFYFREVQLFLCTIECNAYKHNSMLSRCQSCTF